MICTYNRLYIEILFFFKIIYLNLKPALYLVATPIGNREDISMRALHVLKNVDIIACEDTRHSSQLLSVYGIKRKLIALHQHNELDKADHIAKIVLDGKSAAYISDAGTPAISDPGAFLVEHFHNLKLDVFSIPGPSALIAAFSISGFQTSHFQFYGFLPNTMGKRKKTLKNIYNSNITTIFFESPHRIIKTLKVMREIFGNDHIIFIARELTKIFETYYKGKLGELIDELENNKDNQKGEFVLIVSALKKDKLKEEIIPLEEALRSTLNQISLKESVNVISQIYNKGKKEIYNLAMEIKKNE
jgi:16S rRNA (cytidine1402-2'-O)-methyltransferase